MHLPNAVKNIIIINVLLFLASQVMPQLDYALAGFYYQSPHFRPWQIVTHMFMHGGFAHIFFNMYALFIFGSELERRWGSRRFLIYYMVCGLGAFFLHELVNYYEIHQLMHQLGNDEIRLVYEQGSSVLLEGKNYSDPAMGALNSAINTPVVGASGAVFGLLLAFGMLFPNVELMLLFPPIPIKAKWFVLIYGAIEFVLAMRHSANDNVAHYAHLGGMIFGYLLLKFWQKRFGSV
jgi:membrane associated rhomboid family serine protease